MPSLRHGRAARLRVSAGLTVYLACAALAAGPPHVRPETAAGLAAVAAVSFDETVREDAERDGFEPDGLFASVRRRETLPLADEPPVAPLGPVAPLRDGAEGGQALRAGVWSIDGAEDFAPDETETSGDAMSAEAPSFFDPLAVLPPVVRGQSPDISLLSLSTGDAEIENTSLLSGVTGTQGRVRADYLTDFAHTDRIGVQALSHGWLGLGWDGEVNYWQRPIAGHDRVPLWTGDLNLIYNFPFHPRYKFRTGAGAAWLVDRGHVRGGYNVTHGLDVYLLWRAMAIGEIDWGIVGDDKLFRYRVALGLTFELCEIYSGYESYKLGNEHLDGWVNGVAFWY